MKVERNRIYFNFIVRVYNVRLGNKLSVQLKKILVRVYENLFHLQVPEVRL